jgi:hypothetical protein
MRHPSISWGAMPSSRHSSCPQRGCSSSAGPLIARDRPRHAMRRTLPPSNEARQGRRRVDPRSGAETRLMTQLTRHERRPRPHRPPGGQSPHAPHCPPGALDLLDAASRSTLPALVARSTLSGLGHVSCPGEQADSGRATVAPLRRRRLPLTRRLRPQRSACNRRRQRHRDRVRKRTLDRLERVEPHGRAAHADTIAEPGRESVIRENAVNPRRVTSTR